MTVARVVVFPTSPFLHGDVDYFCVQAKEFGISDCNGEIYPAFMAIELKTGHPKDVSGKYIEEDIYNDTLNLEQGILPPAYAACGSTKAKFPPLI